MPLFQGKAIYKGNNDSCYIGKGKSARNYKIFSQHHEHKRMALKNKIDECLDNMNNWCFVSKGVDVIAKEK